MPHGFSCEFLPSEPTEHEEHSQEKEAVLSTSELTLGEWSCLEVTGETCKRNTTSLDKIVIK